MSHYDAGPSYVVADDQTVLRAQYCQVCNAPTQRQCSQCAVFHYCTREHQREHWPVHRRTCTSLKPLHFPPSAIPTISESAPGQIFTVMVILFPAQESVPRLVKAKFRVTHSENIKGGGTRPTIRHRLQKNQFDLGTTEQRSLKHANYPHGPILPDKHHIKLYWRERFLVDGSLANSTVMNLTGGKMGDGQGCYEWKGNILAAKMHGRTERVADLTWKDLPVILKYLQNYGMKASSR